MFGQRIMNGLKNGVCIRVMNKNTLLVLHINLYGPGGISIKFGIMRYRYILLTVIMLWYSGQGTMI